MSVYILIDQQTSKRKADKHAYQSMPVFYCLVFSTLNQILSIKHDG